jgi:hypothetical protein
MQAKGVDCGDFGFETSSWTPILNKNRGEESSGLISLQAEVLNDYITAASFRRRFTRMTQTTQIKDGPRQSGKQENTRNFRF